MHNALQTTTAVLAPTLHTGRPLRWGWGSHQALGSSSAPSLCMHAGHSGAASSVLSALPTAVPPAEGSRSAYSNMAELWEDWAALLINVPPGPAVSLVLTQ